MARGARGMGAAGVTSCPSLRGPHHHWLIRVRVAMISRVWVPSQPDLVSSRSVLGFAVCTGAFAEAPSHP